MTTRKTAVKKTPVKKVVKKAAPAKKITKVQQVVNILSRKANKNISRQDALSLIAKEMKCTKLQAVGPYHAAQARIKK